MTEEQRTENPVASTVHVTNEHGPLTPSATRKDFFRDLTKAARRTAEEKPSRSGKGKR